MLNKILQSPIAIRLFVLFLLYLLPPIVLTLLILWLEITGLTFNSVFSLVENYKVQILMITVGYICITFMLCLKQIVRILHPLQKLRQITRAITNHQYSNEIHIKTGDEFEELAHSFNRMSTHIEKQFNALEMMARIDRIILSTLDIASIVETILVRMQHIIPCDSVSVIVASDKRKKPTFYYRKNPLSTEISLLEMNLNEKDVELLHHHRDYLLIENSGLAPRFLYPLTKDHMAFLLLPIFLQSHLSAIIILGYKGYPKYTSEDLNNAKDLAHRVAVALSNAAWEDKLYHQAHHDSLTDLPNRLLFQDRLKHALTRAMRDQTQVALLFIDLDRFKSINDQLGHEAGDLLLIEIAHRLTHNVRTIDTVSRLGGDEFTIIIPDLQNSAETPNDIEVIVKKLLQAISKPYQIHDQIIHFTCSIGVALFPKDGDNFLDLLRFADSAMFYAKARGKNIYAGDLKSEGDNS